MLTPGTMEKAIKQQLEVYVGKAVTFWKGNTTVFLLPHAGGNTDQVAAGLWRPQNKNT